MRARARAYVLAEDCLDLTAGVVLYHCSKPDYGLCRDDTRATGEQHVAMTEDPTGDYPFTSVPVQLLRPVE